MQGVTGIMWPIAQVVGVPTRMACATQESGTSAFAARIAQLKKSACAFVRAMFQVRSGSLATHCFHEAPMIS